MLNTGISTCCHQKIRDSFDFKLLQTPEKDYHVSSINISSYNVGYDMTCTDKGSECQIYVSRDMAYTEVWTSVKRLTRFGRESA